MFYYESSQRKLGLRFLLFVVSAVCERLGKFYSWARRTKVRNYGASALSKPLDGSTRFCWLPLVAQRFERRSSFLLLGVSAQFWRKEHGRTGGAVKSHGPHNRRCRGKTCRQHDAIETADTNNEVVILNNYIDSSDNKIFCKGATTVLAWSWIFLRWPGKAWKWNGILYWLKCTNPELLN